MRDRVKKMFNQWPFSVKRIDDIENKQRSDEADEALEYLGALVQANGHAVERMVNDVPSYRENAEKLSRTLNQIVA